MNQHQHSSLPCRRGNGPAVPPESQFRRHLPLHRRPWERAGKLQLQLLLEIENLSGIHLRQFYQTQARRRLAVAGRFRRNEVNLVRRVFLVERRIHPRPRQAAAGEPPVEEHILDVVLLSQPA